MFDRYINVKAWYCLKQLPVIFQEEDSMYCVRAQNSIDTSTNWWCKLFSLCENSRFKVLNDARRGWVGGERVYKNLYGVVVDPENPAKISLGLPILPPVLGGPYWIIEAGTYVDLLKGKMTFNDSSTYEWALVSGGDPRFPSNGRCMTGIPGEGHHGFWFLSVNPTPKEGVLSALDNLARLHGYDTTVMVPVQHEGCIYDDY